MSHTTVHPQAKVAACDNPQRLSRGQMKERSNQKVKANLAKLKDLVRNACQAWGLYCRTVTVREPDDGVGLTPSSALPVGSTAASASAASPQLPIESHPAVVLGAPTSLETNEEDGLEELALEE